MKIGIIGGSGLDDPKSSETLLVSDGAQKSRISDIIEEFNEIDIETPYGPCSSKITTGKIAGVDVCILARHGKKHTITPSNVNNRANIYALKKLGCTHILATSACGSLKENIKPGDFVILDQLIDFTKSRKNSFYDNFEKEIVHVQLADPFSEELRKKLISSCIDLAYDFHPLGTVITIEGPRFSTRAESSLFRSWNCDVINMSTAPEASLAREAGIEYAVIAMSTDYDCWKQGEEEVSIKLILARMYENSDKVKKLIIKVIEKYSHEQRYLEHKQHIKSKIRTIPDFPKPGIMFRDITTLMKEPEAMKKVLEIFIDKYKNKKIDIIAGIESRGFIFGALLAEKLNVRFVPIRKPGKLPAETEKEEYDLEYGKDAIEIHKDSINSGDNVLIIDDLLATSGTMMAACKLISRLGGKIIGCGVVIELSDLGGRKKLQDMGYDVFSIIEFSETE